MVVGVEELEAARGSSIISLSRDFKALSAACFKLSWIVVESLSDSKAKSSIFSPVLLLVISWDEVSTFCEHAANKINITKYFLNIFYTLKSTRLIVGVIYPENTKIKK